MFDTSHEVTPHLMFYSLSVMLNVIGEIESLIAQAIAPGTDGDALLKQAQDLVNDS